MLDDALKIRSYPQSIIAWEIKHGIQRYEHNGMVYVCAPHFQGTCESIAREVRQKEAARKTLEAHMRQMEGRESE